MEIKDRIRELRRVPASELLPNPKNWRTHPRAQQDALRGVLAEIGFADAVLARETDQGLQVIDGHLRAEISGANEVPVLVLDVNEEEANKILLTLDPLAAMATHDNEQLLSLLDDARFENGTCVFVGHGFDTPPVKSVLKSKCNVNLTISQEA